MKEINRLVGIGIGVMKRQSSSQWASPTFIIPKKDITVRTITDFRELNKQIVRRPLLGFIVMVCRWTDHILARNPLLEADLS